MDAHYTKRFLASYAEASPLIQRTVDRRVALLLSNLRHPSLRAKKYDEARDIWQARVTANWRRRGRCVHIKCPCRWWGLAAQCWGPAGNPARRIFRFA